jgi:serine/threonine-protein kinase
MGLAPGVRLGTFEIVAPLGAGGMGEVYRARDLKLEREVAVKVLPPHLVQSPEAQARFEREAKAVAALAHPNILAIYDYGEDQGVSYAVTELLEGETLRERLNAGRLPVRKATDLALQIARGLAAAHEKGVVHRDLKPENVFVTHDGRLKILDFGLARMDGGKEGELETLSRHTTPGTVMGTPGYMSPEQARGQHADHRTDVFSFGAVLYEMLSGQRAFGGDSVADALSATLTETPPDLGSLGITLPPALERIVLRCLEKRPGERFQSARDLAFALEGAWAAEPPRTGARSLPSVAVLPFANMSPDKDQDYFCEGMAEDIISALTKVQGLRVVARASSFQFAGKALDLGQIGRTLGVGQVLEGSVRTAGQRLRVTAQLINVDDSSHLWSKRYDRQMEDVFAIQDEISKNIVDALRLRLVGERPAESEKRHTDDLEAYHLYLKGQHNWYRRESDSLQRAASFFGQAAGKDPGYALAHVGLANAYSSLGYYGMEPARAREKAQDAVDRALAVNEDLAEVHAARGLMRMWLLWDWAGSEESFERAIRGNPEDVLAHCWYGFLLDTTGRHAEALASAERALALDPLSPYVNTCVGLSLYTQGRNDEAMVALDRALEMDADFLYTLWVLGGAYSASERHDEAVAALERAVTLSGRAPYYLAWLARACGRSGRREQAEGIVEELSRRSRTAYVSPTFFAWAFAGLGDTTSALDGVEKACEERSPPLGLHQATLLRPLHAEPRFHAVREQMGLEP